VKNARAARGIGSVHLTIVAGEIFCLVGSSGCRKTTLLNILAGFDQPTAGSVRVGNAVVKGPSPDQIVVFQESLIYPWRRWRYCISKVRPPRGARK
jgi:ABC-type nitrate/sulfonate/bicarbonate transport system ATPase subunit